MHLLSGLCLGMPVLQTEQAVVHMQHCDDALRKLHPSGRLMCAACHKPAHRIADPVRLCTLPGPAGNMACSQLLQTHHQGPSGSCFSLNLC